jgi:glycosyltransferase involved in cell wall biosynthesis
MLPMMHLGVPLVATIHHPLTVDRERGFDPPSTFGSRWQKTIFHPTLMQAFVARRIPNVITVSQASRERIVSDFGVPEERIHVVPNGVDTQLFRPRPDVARVPGRVLYVGNLEDPNKGGRYLLHAAALLRPEAHLLIATGGIHTDGWVPRMVEELELDGRVQFQFGLSNEQLAQLYNSAEVGVCASLFEGFGLPAAEAMASGLPLVSANGGALGEVVGSAGVLVPVADPQALADAVNALLGDPARRQALARSARERVLECFQWDHAAAEVEAVYRRAGA